MCEAAHSTSTQSDTFYILSLSPFLCLIYCVRIRMRTRLPGIKCAHFPCAHNASCYISAAAMLKRRLYTLYVLQEWANRPLRCLARHTGMKISNAFSLVCQSAFVHPTRFMPSHLRTHVEDVHCRAYIHIYVCISAQNGNGNEMHEA